MRDNFVVLKLVYGSLTYDYIEEEVMYTGKDFIGESSLGLIRFSFIISQPILAACIFIITIRIKVKLSCSF